MENIYVKAKSRGTRPFSDPDSRLPNRPEGFNSMIPGSQRKGKLAEDLGSGFMTKKIAKGKPWSPPKDNARIQRTPSPNDESGDEIDFLSPRRRKSELIEVGGDMHAFHPKYPPKSLKGLKFKKNKSKDESLPSSQLSNTSSSNTLPTKETEKHPSWFRKSPPVGRNLNERSNPTIARDRTPDMSTYPSRAAEDDRFAPQTTRPKPRPVRKGRIVSEELQPKPFPSSSTMDARTSDVTARNRSKTVSGAGPMSRSPSSPPLDPGRTPQNAKELIPASFPIISPVSSPAHPMRSSDKAPKPKLATAKKPMLTCYHSENAITLEEPATVRKAKMKVDTFPLPSPLSSQTRLKEGPTTAKHKTKTRVIDSDSEGTIKPQPFPMNTQMFSGNESPITPPVSGPSGLGKRCSSRRNISQNERENKKTKKDRDIILASQDHDIYDDDDTLRMSPSADPRSLCPYCDAPLPTSPTPLLRNLLADTAKKSYSETRPGNPLGRKAPFAVFIAVCARHRFESEMLPEAEARGWPKEIKWAELGRRIGGMKEALKALIDDPGSDEDDDQFMDEKGRGPKMRCVFWREIMNEVKKKGSRVVVGVQSQFANFEKSQPGYYGEIGSVIIHETLYDLFPPASINPELVAPLSANEFIQRVMVPEVGVRLIMEDQNLSGDSGMDEAVQILRDSASYGVSMFPHGGDGEATNADDDDSLGVAESILMKRAQKRRKELAEEDEREDEELKRLEKSEKSKKPSSRKKPPSKSKKGRDIQVEPSSEPLPASRPRPRPIGKTASSTSVFSNGTDSVSWGSQSTNNTIEDFEETINVQSKLLVRHSSALNDLGTQPLTRRTTRSMSRSSPHPVLDLCSGSDNSDGSSEGMRGANKQKRYRTANIAKEREEQSDNPSFELFDPRSKTRVFDADDDMRTPMPSHSNLRSSKSSPPDNDPWQVLYPLQMARDRKRTRSDLLTQDVTQRDLIKHSLAEYDWLLSDSSQTSSTPSIPQRV